MEFPVAVTCRVLNVPRSTYYDRMGRPASPRAIEDSRPVETITTPRDVTESG